MLLTFLLVLFEVIRAHQLLQLDTFHSVLKACNLHGNLSTKGVEGVMELPVRAACQYGAM